MTDLLRTLEEINEAGKQLTREAEETTELLRKARERFEAKLYRFTSPSEAMDAFTDGHCRYDQ